MDTTTSPTVVIDNRVEAETGNTSGVAWPAIIGGAFAAAGLMLILSPLGAALGLAWMSPWNYHSEMTRTFTVMSAIWLIIVQWLSSGFGGYLTGRLRMKWPAAAHTHEVFFRDTVHGFMSWALASVAAAVLVASLASIATAGAPSQNNSVTPHLSTGLFRSAMPITVTDQDRAESRSIIAMGAVDGQIPDTQRSYLVELISSRTGVPVIEANTRIDNALLEEKVEVRNTARAAIFIRLSLLIGAFIASAAGALGGIHRDVHYGTGKLSLE